MINSSLEWSVPLLILFCGTGLIVAGRFGVQTTRWGVGLCLLGTGYGFMLIRTETFSAIKPIWEDALILTGVLICCRALTKRFKPGDVQALDWLVAGLFLCTAALSLILYQSVRLETLSILAGTASLIIISLWRVKSLKKTASDKIFIAAFIIIASSIIFQCIFYLSSNDIEGPAGSWSNSFPGVMVQYTGLFGGVLTTFAIVIAAGVDAIHHYRELAHTDPLTQVRNRRGMQAFISSVHLDQGAREPVTIVLADIDHFKMVNDRFGHHAGDLIIADFAQLLQKWAGRGSYVARLGGEEFAVLLPGTSMHIGVTLIEALRLEFASRKWPDISAHLHLTASFGLTTLEHGEPFNSAIARADTNLYKAKQRGRDRLVQDKAA
ncbi:GGDEF domain-containing protein [Brucella intermedia]|uniref:GGDEF domain-containing protein n=1 Tax=Brucella intermedia TaxID=94625 RepID=UPI00158E4A40|nr:GGDEF domain-containing protein [Brucella intermedia]